MWYAIIYPKSKKKKNYAYTYYVIPITFYLSLYICYLERDHLFMRSGSAFKNEVIIMVNLNYSLSFILMRGYS